MNIGERKQQWLILAATILASGVSFLLGSMVTIALPVIQEAFAAGVSGIQWVFNAYMIGLTGLMLVAGPVSDYFGRKRVFLSGTVLFTVGVILSGSAHTLLQLILAQAVTGIGAAFMVPGSLAILNAAFPSERRGRAIGLWAGLSGAIAALGPFIGGFLADVFGWQAVFWGVAPVSLVAAVLTVCFVPVTDQRVVEQFDVLGALLVAGSLVTLSYGLIEGGATGWMPRAVASLIVSGVLFTGFMVNEWVKDTPLVPPAVFENPLVLGADISTFFVYFALQAVFFFLALNLQQIQGLTPTQAGLGLLPLTALIAGLTWPMGRLTDRIGPRPQMIAGPLIMAAGLITFMIPGPDASYYLFLPGLILVGLGMATLIPPITKSALAVPAELSGAASGVNNEIARVAGLVAVAALGTLMAMVFTISLSNNLATSQLSQQSQELVLERAHQLGNLAVPDSVRNPSQVRELVENAFVTGFRWVMGVTVVATVFAALISVWYTRQE